MRCTMRLPLAAMISPASTPLCHGARAVMIHGSPGDRDLTKHEPNVLRRCRARNTYLNPLIYGSLAGKGLFNDVVEGNNGACRTRMGCMHRMGIARAQHAVASSGGSAAWLVPGEMR